MRLSRRWIPWIAAALACVVIADVLALVLQHRDHAVDGRPAQGRNALRLPSAPSVGRRVALPTPHTITRYGKKFTVRTVPAESAHRDPRDPRKVQIFAANAFSRDSADCIRQTRPTAKVAAETGSYIVVATFAYVLPPPPGSGPYGCAFASDQRDSDVARISVQLARPLGSRTLWDVASGRAIALFAPADPPRPRYLPAGFRALPPGEGRDAREVPVRAFERGRSHLQLELTSASDWAPFPAPARAVHIGTRRGTLAVTDHSRCVDWADPPDRVYELCSDLSLNLRELLRTARSVPS